MTETLLDVKNLRISFRFPDRTLTAVDDVSFSIRRGETVALVGESGCGKSLTALSLLRLIDKPGRVEATTISFDQQNLLEVPEKNMRAFRGNKISMIFQEPMTSLNPVFTVGDQIAEVFRIHQKLSAKEARERAIAMLRLVKISAPEQRVDEYPHQLSGGMRQRVMIAIALACRPQLLIADEPTTALDVTIQAQILELIKDMQRELGMAVLLITHNLGIVAEVCDYVLVMYAGKIVERAPVESIFQAPQHPYTRGLLRSLPVLGRPVAELATIGGTVPSLGHFPAGCRFHERCPEALPKCSTELPPFFQPGPRHDSACWLLEDTLGGGNAPSAGEETMTLLEVKDLTKHFPVKGGFWGRSIAQVLAVDGVSFSIPKGKTLGLVGESGCGKSTLGRTLLKLYEPTSGSIVFEGRDITRLSPALMRPLRRDMQIVFQDPYSSLNPRMTVEDIIAEPFVIHKTLKRQDILPKVEQLLKTVGLTSNAIGLYPHEFSGGQRQRIGIARALALGPKLIVADEPVSALDVSIQSQILNLLVSLRAKFDLTYLFISHDLAVIEHISDFVAVMYLGKIVEYASRAEVFATPRHPYTQALIAAIPQPILARRKDVKKTVLKGDVPSPIHPPSGCAFHPRCPLATDRCSKETPMLRNLGPADKPQWVSCHYA